MSSKKLPVRSKVITIAVGLFAAVILFFIGFNFLRIQLDFRKYSNLAQDFNTEMGGGYSTEEDVNCDVDETACPSIKLSNNVNIANVEQARIYKNKIKNYFIVNGFTLDDDQDCKIVNNEVDYCGFSATNKDKKLEIISGVSSNFIQVNIHKK